MLGSGINPESFKLDFGGFSRAAEIQAQGLQNLGQSIGGAIQNFGEAKKEQKKVDAYNKASAKSIEAAITLGKSYEIKGVEETLAPFLQSYNDPNLSPIEKAALLDEGKAMIPNVFGRFDKDQAIAIQKAQNAPPPAPSFGFTGTELKKTDRGDIYVLKGNDGRDYDPETKLPISNLGNFGKGLPPEAWSDGATSAADFIDGALNIPSPIADGSPGSLPPAGDVNPLLPALTPQDAAAIDAILAGGQLAPPVGEPPASIARPQQEPQYTPRYIATDEVKAPTGTVITMDEYNAAVKSGQNIEGIPLPDGKFYATRQRPFAPQQGQEIITNADGTTIRSIALGGKAAQAQRAEDAKVDKAMGLMQDLNLLEKASESMTPGVLGAAGRMVAEQIPATQQAETKDIIDRVNSTLTLSGIQEMRANNPTGAALGSVSDKDMGVLRSSVTALRNAQSPAAFKRELVRLKNLQHDLIYGSERVLKSKLDKGEITQSQFSQAMANAPAEYLDEQGEVRSRTTPTATPYTGLDDATKQALKDLNIDE
jgi:hypothetical protein